LDEFSGIILLNRYWTNLWRDSIEHRRGKPKNILVKLSGKMTGDFRQKIAIYFLL
jgi:hypothetical protein